METTMQKRSAGLIQISDGEAWTTSLVIAEEFGRPHKNVLQSLDALIEDGTLDRGLEIAPTIRDVAGPKGAIRQERAYRLNERAALIAMPFIGGRKSREGQKRLVDAFLAMRKFLKQQDAYRATLEWQEARASGKVVRLEFTDGVQDFVDYAIRQGSRNADKYYVALTKMEYRALFLLDHPSVAGLRDKLNVVQLVNLATAEAVAQRALRDGMAAGMHYKAIYQEAKQRVDALAAMVGKSLPGDRLRRIAA
jgi:phage regulator Rha-like protein